MKDPLRVSTVSRLQQLSVRSRLSDYESRMTFAIGRRRYYFWLARSFEESDEGTTAISRLIPTKNEDETQRVQSRVTLRVLHINTAHFNEEDYFST